MSIIQQIQTGPKVFIYLYLCQLSILVLFEWKVVYMIREFNRYHIWENTYINLQFIITELKTPFIDSSTYIVALKAY